MFILDNENQIEKAMQKARKVKPLVKMIAFGVYKVRGSKGNSYTVKCSRNPLGQKEVCCTCKGAEKGLVCYHSVSALGLHIVLASQKQSVTA